jgi:hypothetical protein
MEAHQHCLHIVVGEPLFSILRENHRKFNHPVKFYKSSNQSSGLSLASSIGVVANNNYCFAVTFLILQNYEDENDEIKEEEELLKLTGYNRREFARRYVERHPDDLVEIIYENDLPSIEEIIQKINSFAEKHSKCFIK